MKDEHEATQLDNQRTRNSDGFIFMSHVPFLRTGASWGRGKGCRALPLLPGSRDTVIIVAEAAVAGGL